MYYNFDASRLPHINRTYLASRNTSWTTSESDNIFIYIFDGECTFEIDGIIYNAEKGCVLFIPANTCYFRRPINDTVCTFLYIHFTLDSELTAMDKQETLTLINRLKIHSDNIAFERSSSFNDNQFIISNGDMHSDDSDINDCIFSIIKFMKNQYIEAHLIISILLWRILSIMMLNTVSSLISKEPPSPTVIFPGEVKDIIFYIKNHYNQNITIEDLCRCCSLSKQQLIRIFKKYLHTTPIAYIIEYRLCVAKSLLMTDLSLSVKEIAYEVGFTDRHYFCRIFKKKIGCTPQQYRSVNKQSEL